MKQPPLDPVNLHSAGATIRHVSPFSEIEVPVEYGENSPHHENWLIPFIYNFPLEARLESFRQNRERVGDALISRLLAQYDWRARKTGAYFAALTDADQHCEQIGRLLVRSDLCYAAERYCLALATFNTRLAVSHLRAYLEYYLLQRELRFDQTTVLGTLVYLDRINRTNFSEPYLLIWHEWSGAKSLSSITEAARKLEIGLDEIRTVAQT